MNPRTDNPDEAEELRTAEARRRHRRAAKAEAEVEGENGPLFDQDGEDDGSRDGAADA